MNARPTVKSSAITAARSKNWTNHKIISYVCFLINPQRACAARVTVSVSVSVCLSVKSHLTLEVSLRP